jgi:type I restriction enzyme M protein
MPLKRPSKRAVLQQLKRDELLAAVDRFGLEVRDRRVRDELVDALAGSRKAHLADILGDLSRDQLKEICRALDLDDSGREKAVLIARLAGTAAPGSTPPPVVATEPTSRRPAAPAAPAVPKAAAPKPARSAETAANLGYEAELWRMADALRGSMDAAEYKHVVLGLIFLKYISDAFEEQHARLVAEQAKGADPEDPDEYRALNIFWVPSEARWAHLKAQAKQPTIGQLVDDAMAGIERDNPSLKSVLPKDYARPALDKTRLGQLIDMISNIKVGDEAARAKDVLGRVYEYFLSQFASAEGKKGGEFYTPRCVRSWWRCSSPTAAASTIPAAAPRACSCSRWSLSARTRRGTATAGRRGLTSRSTARSRTTPPGGSPR